MPLQVGAVVLTEAISAIGRDRTGIELDRVSHRIALHLSATTRAVLKVRDRVWIGSFRKIHLQRLVDVFRCDVDSLKMESVHRIHLQLAG